MNKVFHSSLKCQKVSRYVSARSNLLMRDISRKTAHIMNWQISRKFTIMFLFWTITHLAKKLVVNGKEITTGQTIAVISSGVVGALYPGKASSNISV